MDEQFVNFLKENSKIQPNQKQLKEIKKERRKMGVNMEMVKLANDYYLKYNTNFNYLLDMLDIYFDDIYCGYKMYEDGYEYNTYDFLGGFNYDTPESIAAFCNYIFDTYIIADIFYNTIKYLAEEDLKHYYETKWQKQQTKKMNEIVYKIVSMENYFNIQRKISKKIMKKLLVCTASELEDALEEYGKRMQWFIHNMDVQYMTTNNFDLIREQYKEWKCTMYDCNPIHKFKKRSASCILYKKREMIQTAETMLNKYNNEKNKTCTDQDITNIRHLYENMLEKNSDYDKVCNSLLNLIFQVMNRGDIKVNDYLIEFNIMCTITRNKRRVKKQGFIGSIDMYNSKLGIKKTPDALHKLLF